ncbi:MAG: glycosyltransferase family 4 protein [Pyrinomonadaceae bacterium]
MVKRLKVAYFSPLNPQRSGISDYSEELLPRLAARADVDLYVDGFTPSSRELVERFRVFDYKADPRLLGRLADYDATVYHVGNDQRYHAAIYETALAHPGVVVLHDFALQTFFLELAHQRGDVNLYLDEVEACHGALARAETAETLRRGGTPAFFYEPESRPLNCRLTASAEGVIVHSEWSRARLSQIAPATPVALVSHHVTPDALAVARDDEADENGARGGRRGAVEIASFGFVSTRKGVERTLRALAALKGDYEFRYTLVGGAGDLDVVGQVRALGLADRFSATGYVTLEEFKRRVASADIVVNLRERTVGETSGSACRALAAGCAVVVSNLGWFAELPDDCVVKIEEDDAAETSLRDALARLISDADLRRGLGGRARAYVAAAHSIEKSADEYVAFVREVVARRERRRFVRRVSEALAECGVGEADENLLRAVSAEVARVAPASLFKDEV